MKKIGQDKWMHFGVSLITSIIHPMLAVGLGIGKEYGDSRAKGNKWDWYDILADGIGVAVGTGVRIGLILWIV